MKNAVVWICVMYGSQYNLFTSIRIKMNDNWGDKGQGGDVK